MAAGLGFKTFTTGEVLTAGDVNGYLMQGVLVFATAAARDAAITSPQEGQFAYLKDTNVTTYYTGSAWANLDTTGMTNPMTTTGDMVYSSSGSTPARLGIGTTGQVVTVAGGIPSWTTPAAAASGLTFLKRATFSAVADTGTTFDGYFTSAYTAYLVVIEGFSFAAGAATDPQMQLIYSGTTQAASYYGASYGVNYLGSAGTDINNNANQCTFSNAGGDTIGTLLSLTFNNIGQGSSKPFWTGTGFDGTNAVSYQTGCAQTVARAYTGFLLKGSTGNCSGTATIYGLAKA